MERLNIPARVTVIGRGPAAQRRSAPSHRRTAASDAFRICRLRLAVERYPCLPLHRRAWRVRIIPLESS